MNSTERHQLRYERRVAKRKQKNLERTQKYSNYDDVIGYLPLLRAYKQVGKASKDHASTQKWMSNLLVNARITETQLRNGEWKSGGFNKFKIVERGKLREISAVHISEKGIQNALSNNFLVPLLCPHLIYDNGASLKGKGTDFTLDRFERHLREHYMKYGRHGYIYFFDFKGYFSNVNLDKLVNNVGKVIPDGKLLDLYKQLIYNYKNGGLGLGSQVSQISAVFYPNKLDHYIKDKLGIRGYGRYMDDGYVICDDIDRLKKIIADIEQICDELEITLNKKKCQIIRLDKQFVFLKIKFFITKDGKVVRRLNRDSSRKERQRLRKFKKFWQMRLMSEEHIYNSFHSWVLSLNKGRNYHVMVNAIKYYNNLFDNFPNYYPAKVSKRKHRVLAYAAKVACEA